MSRWSEEQINEGREQSSWNEGYSFGRYETAATKVAATASAVDAVRFADWLRDQASQVRSQDSTAAEWLASKIDELAAEAECLLCDSPAEFDDREEALRKLYQGE